MVQGLGVCFHTIFIRRRSPRVNICNARWILVSGSSVVVWLWSLSVSVSLVLWCRFQSKEIPLSLTTQLTINKLYPRLPTCMSGVCQVEVRATILIGRYKRRTVFVWIMKWILYVSCNRRITSSAKDLPRRTLWPGLKPSLKSESANQIKSNRPTPSQRQPSCYANRTAQSLRITRTITMTTPDE